MNNDIKNSIFPESNGIHALRMLSVDPEKYKHCISGWGDSYINMPERIPFLCRDVLSELCHYFSTSDEVMQVLFETAENIKANPVLKAYIWHLYYRVKMPSFSSGCSHIGFADWFLPEVQLGKNAPAAIALVALGIILDAREKYRSEEYPEPIIKETLGVYAADFERALKQGKVPSVALASLNWLRVYMTARLVQLGRFNFKLMESEPFGIVLKNKIDGRKLMLSQAGLDYNSSGFVLQKNDPLADGMWTSVLTETETSYCGNPVSPEGYALKKACTYPKSEWEKILEPCDVMIDMHIPSGGEMTPERALDSFRKAVLFFSEKYPGKFKKVFICHSWIFNTQFEKRLPDSNLAKLMRECYLFPAPSSGRDGMYFLFGQDYSDLSKAPRDTSVRRAMLEILESGKRLRTGGMILFGEELDQFGSSIYRKTFRM